MLNRAAQKIYKMTSIVWFKRSSMSKTVLKEKQELLGKKPVQSIKVLFWNSHILTILIQYSSVR